MRKVIKKAVKIGSILVLAVVLLLTLAFPLLQSRAVQSWVAREIAGPYLSKELQTRVEIGSVYLRFNLADIFRLRFRNLVLRDVYIEDRNQDTLLLANNLLVSVHEFDLDKSNFHFGNIRLSGTRFYLKTLADSSSNIDFILNYFHKEKTDTLQGREKRPFALKVNSVLLDEVIFRYESLLPGQSLLREDVVNFKDLDVSGIHAEIEDFSTDGTETTARIKEIRLKEKSGFRLDQLSAGLAFMPGEIVLDELSLQTPYSSIRDYLVFRFERLSDFNDFERRVEMEGRFEDSRLAAKDIAWFSPGLKTIGLTAGIDGTISGRVADLRADNLLITLGRSSYFRGNYRVRGLPDVDNTLLQLDFNTLSTNKADLEYILSQVTENAPQLPEFLENAGDIYFTGNFSGEFDDFHAGGELKTSLGRIEGEADMLFTSAIPSYSGSLTAYDLDLGQLMGKGQFGNSTFSASVKGAGFRLQDLEEDLSATISYLDFKGYRYSNVQVTGRVHQKLFEGQVRVNDENLKLDFNGLVNYNPAQPEFRFHSSLEKARLAALNFTRNDIVLSTNLESNFAGTGLEDIQGSILLTETHLQTDTNRYQIDTVQLKASGSSDERLIVLQSDFLDGTMQGQFDITRLPSGIKTVLKQYLPSQDMGAIREVSELQSFNFAFQLKNLEPITAVFLPQLHIPDQGSFYGNFNSSDQKLLLAGGMETVEYAGIVFKRLIIDEENSPEAIFINATVDSVYFSDSLAVNNVSLSNYIRNDSLNFNIKLTNDDGVNRLDVNALIEVDSSSTSFSILPSDIVLDNREWRIEESTQLVYADSSLVIDGFAIRNNGQALRMSGAISRSDSLPLNLSFTDLDIKTFDPLTRQYNLQLGGIMNGEATISAVLSKPKVTSNINVSEFTFNETAIGDLLISSSYNAESQAVNFSVGLLKDMVPTFSISGDIQTGSENNALFADMEFNNAELVLLEPLLGGLVSDLKGQLSGRVLVQGTLDNPVINDLSYLEFENAGLRVDYLKTYYTFSDRVTLSGGRLILNGLRLNDVRGNQATVSTGYIDLSNLADPTLNITLLAQNFQALNTGEQDNNYYYGTMYASGTFSFNGPISNMRIDIDASTNADSKFYLPLYNPEEVGKADFVNFVSKGDTAQKLVERKLKLKGVTLNFRLEVNEGTEVEIIFDKLAGDKIVGRGNAALQLTINSFGTFEIYGNYNVREGEYVFTANNIFNKVFIIQPNSTIRFVGDPYNAQLDIFADYTLNSVDVGPLYDAANINLGQHARVKVVTRINLTGTLENQNATFDIEFPNNRQVGSDTYTYLSNEDNRLTQTTWLLLANSFVNNNLQEGISEAGQATFTELLSGGLSSFINKLTGSSNFDISSRLGTESQEVSTSVRFFENRLIINGSFLNESDMGNTSVNQRDEITQDIEIEYLLSRDGNVRAQLFRRTNVRDFGIISARDEYKHGLGLSYRQEFNSFAEFFQNILRRRRSLPADSIPAGSESPPADSTDAL
ncbi:MAG: translocation/assembly module TamB domain-containing protein [Solitalea sp.]